MTLKIYNKKKCSKIAPTTLSTVVKLTAELDLGISHNLACSLCFFKPFFVYCKQLTDKFFNLWKIPNAKLQYKY